jgi:hypothetical protein
MFRYTHASAHAQQAHRFSSEERTRTAVVQDARPSVSDMRTLSARMQSALMSVATGATLFVTRKRSRPEIETNEVMVGVFHLHSVTRSTVSGKLRQRGQRTVRDW